MKIAITYDNGKIFQHFGHTKMFKIYEIQNKEIINEQVIPAIGSGHGALASFLSLHNVSVLICGGIGDGAKKALEQAGILLYGGVSGLADDAIKSYLDGNLAYNPDVKCNHHGHEHNCASHNCSSNHC